MLENEYCVRAPLRTGIARNQVGYIDNRNYYVHKQQLSNENYDDTRMICHFDKLGQKKELTEEEYKFFDAQLTKRFMLFFKPLSDDYLEQFEFKYCYKKYAVRDGFGGHVWMTRDEMERHNLDGYDSLRIGVKAVFIPSITSDNTEIEFEDEMAYDNDLRMQHNLIMTYRGPLVFR